MTHNLGTRGRRRYPRFREFHHGLLGQFGKDGPPEDLPIESHG
jgi:hypothetical protein